MPTYVFKCEDCNEHWEEHQSITDVHISNCPKCKKECENMAFGGSGFQFSGRLLNKQLTDFPDYANKITRDADKDAADMEKTYDAYVEETLKKEKKEN